MKAHETIDFPIRQTWHKIMRIYNSEATKYGGSMSLGYILLNIDQKNGEYSTKLGPKMGMESTSLARTLKTMEEKNLIYRQVDDKDKRRVKILLTEDGKKLRTTAKDVVIKFNNHIQSKIKAKKLTTFFEVIQQINDIIDNEDIFKNEENN